MRLQKAWQSFNIFFVNFPQSDELKCRAQSCSWKTEYKEGVSLSQQELTRVRGWKLIANQIVTQSQVMDFPSLVSS